MAKRFMVKKVILGFWYGGDFYALIQLSMVECKLSSRIPSSVYYY